MAAKRVPQKIPLLEVGGATISLAGGILLLVTSVRDYLFYLDDYDLRAVGTTGSLEGVVFYSLIGSLLVVVSLHMTISLAVTKTA